MKNPYRGDPDDLAVPEVEEPSKEERQIRCDILAWIRRCDHKQNCRKSSRLSCRCDCGLTGLRRRLNILPGGEQ